MDCRMWSGATTCGSDEPSEGTEGHARREKLHMKELSDAPLSDGIREIGLRAERTSERMDWLVEDAGVVRVVSWPRAAEVHEKHKE